MSFAKPEPPAAAAAPNPFVDSLVPACKECPYDTRVVLDESGGKHVCTECGLVCGDRFISDESEWRTFKDDAGGGGADRSRVGGPSNPLLDTGDLSTAVGGDAKGSALAKWQNVMAGQGRGKALLDGFSDVSEFATRMDLGGVIETRAKELFHELHESKVLRGRQRLLIVTSCLFVACRESNVDRSRNELCRITGVDRRDLGRVLAKIQAFQREKRPDAASSGVKKRGTKRRRTQLAPSTVVFMNRYCSQLVLDRSFINAATEVVEQIEKLGICAGRTPATIAGAAIYLTSLLDLKTRRSLDDIADVATIAVSTIRNAYRIIYPHRCELVPASYKPTEVVKAMPAP